MSSSAQDTVQVIDGKFLPSKKCDFVQALQELGKDNSDIVTMWAQAKKKEKDYVTVTGPRDKKQTKILSK